MGSSGGEKVTRSSSGAPADSAEQPKAKKKGGLFSFLNCCGASEDSHDPDSRDTAHPVKQAGRIQPTRSQQPGQSTSSPQQNASATENSAEASKEVIDEKSAQPSLANGPGSEMKTVEAEKQALSDGAVEQSAADQSVTALAREDPEKRRTSDHTTGAIQPIITSGPSLLVPGDSSTGPPITLQAPTPVVSNIEPPPEIDPTSDRTSQQIERDEDIEMNDKVPMTEEEAKEIGKDVARQNESSQSYATPTTLPPPPPLQTQNAHDGASLSRDESSVSLQDPNQRWLLPPMRPEHKGRKCLVLDLDETLVHSSFKVN
jgi:RNA polymerase II subunit A small phosphatase-like protein